VALRRRLRFVAGGTGHWDESWTEVNGAKIGYEGRVMGWELFRDVYGDALKVAGRWPADTPP
jgi:hypothetical protein